MNTLRYLKLQNDGAFVAQIVMEYRERHTDGQGNVSFAGEWKSWYTAGYRDILQYAERSVDLAKDSNIPNGSQVRLHVYVAAGYSNPSVQQYIYDETSGAQAVYEISGTTLNNYLKLVSYG